MPSESKPDPMFALVAGIFTSTSLRSPRRSDENCRRINDPLGKNLLPHQFVTVLIDFYSQKSNQHVFIVLNQHFSIASTVDLNAIAAELVLARAWSQLFVRNLRCQRFSFI